MLRAGIAAASASTQIVRPTLPQATSSISMISASRPRPFSILAATFPSPPVPSRPRAAWPPDVAAHREALHARALVGTHLPKPFVPVLDDGRDGAKRLGVVDDRRAGEEGFDRRERRLDLRIAPVALERGEQPGFFAADI